MVLVKIEPKEALCFIKLRQSIPHSWDMVGNEVGSEGVDGGVLHVCVCDSLHHTCSSLQEQSKNHMNILNKTPNMTTTGKVVLSFCFYQSSFLVLKDADLIVW